jgi:HlyD family secretion protein
MNKKLISILVLILLIGGIGAQMFLRKAFDYAGTVEATRIDLPARVATVIKSILVDEGSLVKKDQIIIELACEDIAIHYSLIKENYERAVKLKNTGSISKEAFDTALNKMQEADIRLAWCEIKAPFDGTVLTRFLEPAEWVNPGTKILSLGDLRNLWTYFYVSQELMSQLKVGAEVIGSVPEINKSFRGKIVKINDEAEFTPKNVQTQTERTRLIFGIKVAFKNDEGFLKPGMSILSTLKQP